MTENSAETTTTSTDGSDAEGEGNASDSQFTQQDIDKLNAALAKERGLRKELEKAQREAMTADERAISEAESRGRTAAVTELGMELAQSQFDAAAGRRNADFDTAKVLRRLDLKTLLDDDGRPDSKAIADAVADLVPEPAGGTPSFDGGSRTATRAVDFNQELRKAAGRA